MYYTGAVRKMCFRRNGCGAERGWEMHEFNEKLERKLTNLSAVQRTICVPERDESKVTPLATS